MKKTYHYRCGHTRTTTEKLYARELTYCNICGAYRENHVTVFCIDCGNPVETSLRRASKMKRCPECARQVGIERTKANWRKHHAKYNKRRRKRNVDVVYGNPKRVIGMIFKQLREKYKPPEVNQCW